MHKFLVLLADSSDLVYELSHDYRTKELADSIFYHETPMLKVITCRHEKLGDNLVQVDTEYGIQDLLRDVNGKLYHIWEAWDKIKVINKFE